MIRLSVNINKVALIRNSRGENLPDLAQFALDCESFGADGITVHPRPDERHIRYSDIPLLKETVETEFNIEGYPSTKFLDMVLSVAPHQCTLVPDPPGVLTSSEGWDPKENMTLLRDVVSQLHERGIRVSLFMDPNTERIRAAADTGTDRIELYTGHYARQFSHDPEEAVVPHRHAAKISNELGMAVNAGHDLNLRNLKYYATHVPGLKEVSIGHALISDALYYGIQNTIGMYKAMLS